MKRVIITNKQLNEIIKEENTTTVQLNTTGNTIPAVTNTVMSNTPEINNASKYGDVNLHISNQKLNGSNDSVPTQHVEVEKGQNINQAIQQQVNPTVLSDGGDIEVSGDGISEGKSFSKRQIEEARLEKIRKEGSVMTKKQLKEEWEGYENLNEDEIDWNQRKQMRMDNFWDTLEYYIGLKDEQGSLNPEQLAHAEDVCNKLSCFGADAEEFCDYAREALGLNQIDESYKWYLDNNDDISGGFDSSQFISHFREIEEKYYDLPEDYELEDYYNRLLEEWGDFSDEERSSYKSFEQYCDSVISDYLYEKYSEKGMNKMQESKIEINPKNKGKFNATKKKTGKSTEELTHSKNPLTRKRANFAKMAKRHWKPLKNSE